MQSVDLNFQGGVPGELPPPPKPVLQAYFILSDCRYRMPCVVTRATLGSGCRQSLKDCAGEFLNARVDSHLIVQFRNKHNFIFHISLEFVAVSASDVRASRWVVEG
jgi:hypothetical protein